MTLLDKTTTTSMILIGTLCAYASGLNHPLGLATGITCIISAIYIHNLKGEK